MVRRALASKSRISFVRSLALLAATGGTYGCAAAVMPGSADAAGDTAADRVAPSDTPIDMPIVRVEDAGAGCPQQRPSSGQPCSDMARCDYSMGRCETTLEVLCNCTADPSGNRRWACSPNCDIGPLAPPELAA